MAPEDPPSEFYSALMAQLLPEKRTGRRLRVRQIDIELDAVSLEDLEAVMSEITGAPDLSLGVKEIQALLTEIEKHEEPEPERAAQLRQSLAAFVTSHWDALAEPLAEAAIAQRYGATLFLAFPALKSDPVTISALVEQIERDKYFNADSFAAALAHIEIRSRDSARLLLAAAISRPGRGGTSGSSDNDKFLALLFSAIGRDLGWEVWLKLFGFFLCGDFYTDANASRRMFDGSPDARWAIDAQTALLQELSTDHAVQKLAGHLLELLGESWNLLSRPAETRNAFVNALLEASAENSALREAAIEALLWFADNRAAELALFAAARLATPADRPFLAGLIQHPAQLVQYGARAVLDAVFGAVRTRNPVLPRAGAGILSGWTADLALPASDEPAQTWLGDRMTERLIEQTVASVENQFGREYGDHGEEGEERILAILFERLAGRFEALEEALRAAARATSSARAAHVSMRYRAVDKHEEGKKGIRGAKRFSADLCLIVDPTLDGRPLGRKVTLIQAKRLYRYKGGKKTAKPRWHSSFHLKMRQLEYLIKQTQSSVCFFHGPPLGGRGVPVIPAQLVLDLAVHQRASGAQLDKETVAVASRSLADWLTYDALALRIGDPVQELTEKAGGTDGSLPRLLLEIPTVEVEVGISSGEDKDRH